MSNAEMPAFGSSELSILANATPATVFAPGAVNLILDRIKAEVLSVDVDISTPSGRKDCASLAYKVARSKTALDDMGKTLVAEWKTRSAAVDAERRRIRDELDALRDQVRKPLDEYEQAEKDRIDGHENALRTLLDLGAYTDPEPQINEIERRLRAITSVDARDWEEFRKRAENARVSSNAMLTALQTAVIKRDAEQVELERHRQEEAARQQRERDEQIAKEAAEQARQEAEEKANRERHAIEAEKAAAEARAVKAEEDRKAAIAKAKADAEALATRVEQDRQNAAIMAKQKQEAAIEAERRRIAADKAAEGAAQAARERDREHRKRINNDALTALTKHGITTEQGKAIILAIGRGEIPHVRIAY